MASITARRSVLRGRPPNLGGGQKGRDHRPFLIRHVTRISGRHTPVVVASDLVPGHLILRPPTRRGNHNPLMPLNSFTARLSLMEIVREAGYGAALQALWKRSACEERA